MAAGSPESAPLPDKADVIALPPIIVGATLVAGLLIDWSAQIPPLPVGSARWLGAVPVAIAGVIAFWAKSRMTRKGTPVNPQQPTTAVVTDGPFRFSRNPLYVSLSLLYVGIGVLAASTSMLVLAVPLVIILQKGVIEREERYLERKFGEEYRRYKTRVRRWV